MKLWEKEKELDKEVETFTVGNDYLYDQKLIKFDCVASKAHAEMLFDKKVLSKEELEKISKELDNIIELNKKGNFVLKQSDEDVHSKIENHLTEKLGDAGKKIHTLRSRNDQILVALNLYLKENISKTIEETKKLIACLEDFDFENNNLVMPGYTHMQRAMPSTLGLWVGSFTESLKADIEALELAFSLVNINPLGSGAGYSLPVEIDKELTTKKLGFEKTQKNSLYVQNSRTKKELMVVFSLNQIMITLNKLATDLLLFTTKEFGFFSLPQELCTGSSIMPQKKNYDVLEILRGNSSVVYGNFSQIFSIGNNLPSGYNRDTQLTKPALMDSFEITLSSLKISQKIISNLEPNKEKMKEACSEELYAAQKATELAMKGVPFRDAYKKVSKNP